MKKIILAGVLFFLFACKENAENQNKIKKQYGKNTANYEFLQSKNKQKAREILIVVTDPHGDGKFALSHFKKVADNFDCTIIGLNDVENNVPDFEKKIENNVSSASKDLNLNVKQLYVAGFSGGARMAFQYALSHRTNGVLMCGAGINLQKASNLPFPLAMITGTKDFNFIEQYYSPYSTITKNKNILTLIFDGKHEWPPEKNILTGMSFLFSKNNISGIKNEYLLKEGDSLAGIKDFFEVFKMYEAAYKNGIPGSEKRLDDLLNSSEFKNFISLFESNLQEETERNSNYIKYFNEKDINWWESEIWDINKLVKQKNKIKSESFARTKAFLGIAAYSLVNGEITNPWSKNIDKYLKIYEMLEPENPDMCFFNAVRQKQKNNSALSEKYLKRAVAFGFKDSLKAKRFGLEF